MTRVDTCGKPIYGPCSQVVTKGFISAEITAEVDEGEDVDVKTASGEACVAEAGIRVLRYLQLQLELCEIDPDMLTILNPAWAKIANYAGDTVGWAETYTQNQDSGFAIEIWTNVYGKTNACKGEFARGAWGYMLIPWLSSVQVGDRTIENDALSLTLTGNSKKGSYWGRGPYDVMLNPQPGGAPKPGPLLQEWQPDWSILTMYTDVKPPDAKCGCQPVNNPDGPAATIEPACDDPMNPNTMSVRIQATSANPLMVNFGDGSAPVALPEGGLTKTYGSPNVYTVSVFEKDAPHKVTSKQFEFPVDCTKLPPRVWVSEGTNENIAVGHWNVPGAKRVRAQWASQSYPPIENLPASGSVEQDFTADPGGHTFQVTDMDNPQRTATVSFTIPFGGTDIALTARRGRTATESIFEWNVPGAQTVMLQLDDGYPMGGLQPKGSLALDMAGMDGEHTLCVTDEQSEHRSKCIKFRTPWDPYYLAVPGQPGRPNGSFTEGL